MLPATTIFALRRPSQYFAVLLALGLAVTAVVTPTVSAELQAPRATDRQITRVVAQLLGKEHLSKHPLDDEMSQRCLDNFLKSLDPMKLYFYEGDVARFTTRRHELDDFIRRGNIDFAYDVFRTLLARIDERVANVDELLKVEHDFTVDEELVTDADSLSYPQDAAEAYERWRHRIKYDLLVKRSEETSNEEAIEQLTRRYHSFAKRMRQTKNEELLEMYLTALTTGYDPHTTYMAPSTLENFRISMRLNLEGIGAALQYDDGNTVVTKVIPGGAADKQGELKPKDRIIAVGQDEEGEWVDVVDMRLTDVVQLIRGDRGTVVRLKVIQVSKSEPIVMHITRDKVELTDSEARGEIIEEGEKPDGSKYKVGVINLPSFYMDMEGARLGRADFKSTTRDVARLLADFRKNDVDAVVVDLRRNGGGSLTEAISLTGLFIDQGPIVQVKDSAGRVQHYDDLDRGVGWDGPMVVMISKFSASASEIFAGAIQDYQRGLILGDRATHGKGTVQSLMNVSRQLFRVPNAPELGALKITMQQFYRPSGDSTQNRGVVSDLELPSLTTHLDVGESDLDFAMDFDRVRPVPHAELNMLSKPILEELRRLSAARTAESEDFQKVERRIVRYNEQKERKSITLNEEKFMSERSELEDEDEDEKELDELNELDNPVVRRDFYFDETLAVTFDYLEALRKFRVAGVAR